MTADAPGDIPSRIRHDAGAGGEGSFRVEVDGVEAELGYRLDGDTMILLHTGVPGAIGGRGIAGDLVRAALDHARSAGWKVRAQCSYADAWIGRHPEYEALRA